MTVKITDQFFQQELIMTAREESCGYMDNSPLHFELPTYPQHYCYYSLNFLKNKTKGCNKGLNLM
ncbi:hypothetical protein ES703_19715 [subsurface metagenome]